MVSTRGQKGQNASNTATRKMSTPGRSESVVGASFLAYKAAAKTSKMDAQTSRKRVRVASSDVEAEGQPIGREGPTMPGFRERLLSLPVDVFAEICSFLDALELRRLALMDKTFWSVLVSTRSDPIWRQAFRQAVPPVPDCPETMSWPNYAQFILVESCMSCHVASGSVCFDFFHRVRYCNKCHPRNILSKDAVLKLLPKFPARFLKYLSSDAVSSEGDSLAASRGRYKGSTREYLKETVVEVYNLWKSLSKPEGTRKLANTRLMERLEKYAESRIKSGLKMAGWHIVSADWRAAHLKKLKNERKAAILSRLMDLGYDEADFPQWDPEVNKLEALSDEEWERIRPTVVDAAEWTKNNRISGEAWRRRHERARAIFSLWDEFVAVASGTRAVYTAEKAACSDFNEFLTFAPISALMAVDTDGILAQELEPIRPGALQFVIQRRRRHLVRLRNILNGVPLDHIDEEEWSSLTNDETIARLDTIAAYLTKAVNGFWDSNRKQVEWYPSYSLPGPNADLAVLTPVESLSPGLMAKMLETIGKDTNADSGVVVTSPYFGQNVDLYRCARCDERVAPYLTFKGMLLHFLEKKVWFDKASEAKEKALSESSGSKDPTLHSTLFNDHDWNSEEDIMVIDDSDKMAQIRELWNQLEAAYGHDPRDRVVQGFSTTNTSRPRKSTKNSPQRVMRRICRLCPEGFSPKPMYLATLEIHIQHV
ncbi:hypothetical protein FRC01_008159 [Tulasnella sp. 417]|nr:hypothetical protein FRC01_008159 [Tulasnella sp. 417]